MDVGNNSFSKEPLGTGTAAQGAGGHHPGVTTGDVVSGHGGGCWTRGSEGSFPALMVPWFCDCMSSKALIEAGACLGTVTPLSAFKQPRVQPRSLSAPMEPGPVPLSPSFLLCHSNRSEHSPSC